MIAILRQSYALLSPRQRRLLLPMLLMLLVAALLEAIGLALILPLVRTIIGTDGMATPQSGFLAQLVAPLADLGLMNLCIIIAIFYLLKNSYLFFSAWAQNSYIMNSVAAAATQEVSLYLQAPLLFHLSTNSSELVRNCTRSIDDLYRGVVRGLLGLVTEGLVLLGMVSLLMIADFWTTLAVGTFLATAIVTFQWRTHRAISRWGGQLQANHADLLRELNHSFGSIKELLVLHRNNFFVNSLGKRWRHLSSLFIAYQTINEMPRYLIETILVLAFMATLALSIQSGQTGSSTLSLIAIYAMAGFRLLPAFNRILLSANTVRFSAPTIPLIAEQQKRIRALVRPAASSSAPMPVEHAIVLDKISFKFPAQAQPAIAGIDLTIRRGESIAFVGASGAGKTTLADILLGLLPPDQGSVKVDGQNISDNLAGWQRTLGYVPQAIFLIDDTLRRNIAFGVEDAEIDDEKVMKAIKLAHFDDVLQTLPDGLDTPLGEQGSRLSGGQRQRVGLARALYHEPLVLILDEATSALDGIMENLLVDTISEMAGSKTVIIIAHRLNTVRNCDRIVLMSGGQIAACGRFEELKASSPEFKHLLEMSA